MMRGVLRPTEGSTAMDKIILDKDLREKLNGLTTSVPFCDESGKIIGHFLPDDVYKKLVYGWLKSQHTDEELEEDLRQTGGRPLAEIWKDLGAK
jgi:hypothetical protein